LTVLNDLISSNAQNEMATETKGYIRAFFGNQFDDESGKPDLLKIKSFLTAALTVLSQQNHLVMKSKITYDDWLIVSNKLKNIKDVDLEQIRKLDILFAYLNQTEQGQQSSFLAEEQSQEVKNFIEKISKNEGYLTLSLLRDYVSKGEKGAVYLKAFVDRMNSNNTEQSYYFKPSGPTKELKTISMAGYRAGLNTFKEKYYAKYRGQLMMDLVNDPALQAAEKGSREYAFKRKEMESVYRLGGEAAPCQST
jgi:hypothetical protein